MKNVQHNDVRFHNALCRNSPMDVVRIGTPGGDDSAYHAPEPPGREATPSTDMRQVEQRERIEQALLALDDAADADIVRWRFFDGMSLAEIGQRLGRDESTVRYRLQRALDGLGEQLRDWQ